MHGGLLGLTPLGIVIYTVVVTHITICAVTIFLHRCQAHRALELHSAPSHFFRFWLWLTTGMVTREWVAVHRKHHARCEGPQDPHSPQVVGLRKVLLQGTELYRAEARRPETLEKYGRGTPDDWLERHLYTRHGVWGVGLMLVIDLVLLGPIGLSVWGLQMLWIPLWAAGVINGVGHYLGYRNFATPDASTNIVPWGVLIGGEELHNNHHAYPTSARFSSRRGELDIGWIYIRLLERVGLARVRRVAPPWKRVAWCGLDGDSVQAVMSARLRVLAVYDSRVLARVFKNELRHSRDIRVRTLLKAVGRRLKCEARLLDEALAQCHALRMACQFRARLEAIWHAPAPEGAEAIARSLRQWCGEAEASGIEALREFALHLDGSCLQRG